jgi:DNA replication protein DnaC
VDAQPAGHLVIDEVGYSTLDPLQSSLLFQVMCQRYQRGGAVALSEAT